MDTYLATEEGSRTRNRDMATMTSYGRLINILTKENKTLLREKESTQKKFINAELAITFNDTYYILYIHIYLPRTSTLTDMVN